MKRNTGMITIVIAFISGAAISGLLFMHFFILKMGGYELLPEVSKYASIRSLIEEKYIGDIDIAALDSAVFKAMTEALDDKWSYYLTAAEYKNYKDYTQNSYTGIGINISQNADTGLFDIISVTENSPAEKVGIMAGQVLVAIDDEPLSEMEIDRVRDLIKSKEGNNIKLTLLSEDQVEIDVIIKSALIFVNPISYEMLDNDIGYIKIINFEDESADGFINALEALKNQGATSYIFDVRGNPGGKLDELLAILDYLLPEGDLFISSDKAGNEIIETSDANEFIAPMAVLINADSYSAAEFFAADLAEYHWATIVGEQSTGKGRSQQTFEFDDGSAIHLSTSEYLTADRVNLAEAGGVKPDIEVEADSDKQLEAAIAYLLS